MSHQPLPRGRVYVARTMSRLLAPGRVAHLPDRSQWRVERALCPLQWRGRTGIAPVSVAPVRKIDCDANLDRHFLVGKRRGELRLERSTLPSVRIAIGLARCSASRE